ncbi:hypothetical protein LZC94_13820 [Pendulispora albinea]|uniref:Uncharacterized protein n=2 Tax=Pendulispora albinea TaxID=2741071 RepID=A0ABZ2MCG7_9BACT
MPILAHLSGKETMRFSDLERAIPQASQKDETGWPRSLPSSPGFGSSARRAPWFSRSCGKKLA